MEISEKTAKIMMVAGLIGFAILAYFILTSNNITNFQYL